MLTNFGVWNPDGCWVVHDTRKQSDVFDGQSIRRTNVKTGEVQTLFTSKNGATCGVATHHPHMNQVAFIVGPEFPTPEWDYAFSRRRGLLVNYGDAPTILPLDAMNYGPSFVPGALRGGSHVHVFCSDGTRVSFTYDDEVLTRPRVPTAVPNLRNIAVAGPGGPVHVTDHHPRNQDGTFFSVVATRTTTSPKPGSDDIRKACEEGWIGTGGYVRADGLRQKYALAFQGEVIREDGQSHSEVYVADLPEDLTRPGDQPLEGTETTRPAPPFGTLQRRLTFTSERKFPGLQGPRHWLRSSPDGSLIAFLMKDDAGTVQIFLIPTIGGPIRQLTSNPWSIASAFTWSPDGRLLAHVMDNSIFVTDARSGEGWRLTARSDEVTAPRPYACVFSPTGRHIAYARHVAGQGDQLFIAKVPSLHHLPS